MNEQLNSNKLGASLKMLIAVAAIALAATACTTKKKELTSKVDPNAYVAKADFQKGPYHYSRAFEEADSNNRVYAIPGFQMDFGIVNVEITETELRLVSAFDPSGRTKTAQVLSSFPIKQHFDIIREENDFKEKTHRIVEDSSKPWNQRQYMRVDWSHPSNQMGSLLTQLYGGEISEENTVMLADPSIDTDGHVSFVVETGVNEHRIMRILPPFGEDLVSASRVTYRTHLTPAAKSDFKPVSYSLKDFGRFGYFVTQQNFENPEKGYLDQDLKIYAHVFNVCEAGRAGSCSTNKIKWVLTKDFPEKYLAEARQAIKSWNETFKGALNRSDDVVVLDETFQVDLGDTRFNTIAHYEPKSGGGLLGVAQGVHDPRTGETISVRATVYEDGIRYEQGMIDNLIDLITSNDPLAQVIGTEAFGPVQELISPYAAANKSEMRLQHKLMGLDQKVSGDQAVGRPGIADIASIVGIKSDVSSNASGRPLPSYLKGNSISKASLSTIMTARPDLLRVPELDQLAQDDESSKEKNVATITERLVKIADKLRTEKKGLLRQSAMGVHGSDLVEDAVIRFLARQVNETGSSKVLADRRDEIKAKVAKLIFYTTLLHEMGHTFGLRHNFKGSADRNHYYPEWKSLKARLDAGDKDVSRDDLAPYAYSSIMDYGADFFSQAGGLGPYDKAAIKYAYNRSIDRDTDPVTKENFYFCTDHQVGEEILCRRFDRGSTVTEVTEHAIDSYNRNWALSHFRRGRSTFDMTSGSLADRIIVRTMIPVRQVMDEFIFSLITKRPATQADAKCRYQFMEDAIRNGDMANVCDAEKAKEAGVDLADMTTWANSLYGKDGKLLKADSGEMKPYGLGDLLRANELAQKFFAEVIGSIEPGFYLAAPGDEKSDPTLPRELVVLDKDLSRRDLAEIQAGRPSANLALKKLAAEKGEDPDEFVAANANNLVRIDVGRYGRPFSSNMKEEGTMRTLQNVGSLADKVAATFALALRDIGVSKYQDISMTGNPYDYPQSKVFTAKLFTKMLTEDMKIAKLDLVLPDGKAVKAVGQGVIDFNLQRIGIILALTQFVTDSNPSAIQKMRVCISGEAQCGNALSTKVVESWNSTGAFTYRAVQTLEGDSIAYELISNMKKLSDKRAPFIEKLRDAKKLIAENAAKMSGTAELRARISANLDKVPALAEKLKPLVQDPKDGVEPQGYAAVVLALKAADGLEADEYLQAVAPGVLALKAAAVGVVAEVKKLGDAGKCESGDDAAKAECAKTDEAILRGALTQLAADFVELFGIVRPAAVDTLQIKQAPSEIKDGSDAIASEEVKVELLRTLMNVLGWR